MSPAPVLKRQFEWGVWQGRENGVWLSGFILVRRVRMAGEGFEDVYEWILDAVVRFCSLRNNSQ